jgi:DNA-directed RNA polymerase subunit RPC12/RpoP
MAKFRCPKCKEEIEPKHEEDEDSYWSECPKCGHTFNYSIKWGFG